MNKKLVAGNWKMNGSLAALEEVRALLAAHPAPSCDVLLCPPATLIPVMAELTRGTPIRVGGQDCHARASGAYTGDISAVMLTEAGASSVILGHSERRTDHGETDDLVRSKSEAALAAGLQAIICIGETEAQRDRGEALAIIGAQLSASLPTLARAANITIAYEPVWAIGTGRTPTIAQIGEVHAFMRQALIAHYGADGATVRLLYGGSVKASNAVEIFTVPNVDGALVSGASLKAADFGSIIAAAAVKPRHLSDAL